MPLRDRVLLVFEDEGGDQPAPFDCRLRRLLKAALRAYGLRCRWAQDAAGWKFGDELRQTEPTDLGDHTMGGERR